MPMHRFFQIPIIVSNVEDFKGDKNSKEFRLQKEGSGMVKYTKVELKRDKSEKFKEEISVNISDDSSVKYNPRQGGESYYNTDTNEALNRMQEDIGQTVRGALDFIKEVRYEQEQMITGAPYAG